MKKKILHLMSFVLVLVLSLGIFAGCNIVTVDNEKDMNQVVASVQIDTKIKSDDIYKKDMVMAYLNYGYYYVQQGYSSSAIFQSIIDNLIDQRILIQYIMLDAENSQTYLKGKERELGDYVLDSYISDDEAVEAEYNTLYSLDNMIKSYMKKDETTYSDSLDGDVRTAPTNASTISFEPTKSYMSNYVNDMKTNVRNLIGEPGSDKRVAYEKVLTLLQNNGLIGDIKDKDENFIFSTSYYTQNLKGQKESILVNKFEEIVKFNERVKFVNDFSKVENAYVDLVYSAQAKEYTSEADFKTALESASNDEPIVYSPTGRYGYVYNLLLGATDNQLAEISEIKSTLSDIEKATERQTIYKNYTVKDRRASWVYSGYNYDADSNTFYGRYTFSSNNSIPYNFDKDYRATWLNKTVDGVEYFAEKQANNGYVRYYHLEKGEKVYDDSYTAQYSVTANQISLDDFITKMDDYLFGKDNVTDITDAYFTSHAGEVDNDLNKLNTYRLCTSTNVNDNYLRRMNELLFAFSTDSGSLNTYRGYVIDRTLQGTTSSWVSEFQKGGEIVLDLMENTTGIQSSYIIVASDYGYHVMIYSQLFDANWAKDNKLETLNGYLNFLYGEQAKSWADILKEYVGTSYSEDSEDSWDKLQDAYYYLYSFVNTLSNTSTVLTNLETKIYNDYNTSSYVTKYTARYADLLN